MFSVLVFMCRDPGDATSKVSCCVESSYCLKNSENENTVNLKSASFILIMLSHEGLTRVHSQNKPRSHFGERFPLTMLCWINYQHCIDSKLESFPSSNNSWSFKSLYFKIYTTWALHMWTELPAQPYKPTLLPQRTHWLLYWRWTWALAINCEMQNPPIWM